MNQKITSPAISGIGWADAQSYGCVMKGERNIYSGRPDVPPPWQNHELFGGPVKNIGRFDPVSRLTICSCALALRDAGITPDECRKQNIGIIGTSPCGSIDANRAYFSDYLDAGRKLGRANFFIYTLPTSPLAESAIYFGLKACNVYVNHAGEGVKELLNDAMLIISDGQADKILAVKSDGNEAFCFLLSNGSMAPDMAAKLEKSLGRKIM